MFPTVETRWFYPGAIPPAVLAWYHDGERAPQARRAPEVQPTRVDYYLRLPERDDLGIKLREGRIEIKQRAEVYGVERLHARVHGMVQGWRKWSFGVSDIGSGLGDLTGPHPAWIGIRKARCLRRYRITDAGEIVAIAGAEIALQGCTIELAEVDLHTEGVLHTEGALLGKTWWSLAFETFGPEATLHATFKRVTERVLHGDAVPFLDAEHSYGYAQWLKITYERVN